jgi:hypothetical protein
MNIIVRQTSLFARAESRIARITLKLAYLCLYVLKRRRADETKADEEDVCLWVRQRPKTVVVLLSCGIPEAEVDGLAVDHDIGRVIVEDRRDVFALDIKHVSTYWVQCALISCIAAAHGKCILSRYEGIDITRAQPFSACFEGETSTTHGGVADEQACLRAFE